MLTTVEKVLFLKSIDLFAQIPGEDLAQISQITEEVAFGDGEVIFEVGELGDALFMLIAGRVRIHLGARKIAELGEGECFGEMAILDRESRSATVTAIDDVDCLKIEREDFYEIMAEKPEIAQGIIQVLTRRLREANAKANVATEPVSAAAPELKAVPDRVEAVATASVGAKP